MITLGCLRTGKMTYSTGSNRLLQKVYLKLYSLLSAYLNKIRRQHR